MLLYCSLFFYICYCEFYCNEELSLLWCLSICLSNFIEKYGASYLFYSGLKPTLLLFILLLKLVSLWLLRLLSGWILYFCDKPQFFQKYFLASQYHKLSKVDLIYILPQPQNPTLLQDYLLPFTENSDQKPNFGCYICSDQIFTTPLRLRFSLLRTMLVRWEKRALEWDKAIDIPA